MGTIRDRTAASEQKELFSIKESNKNISSQKYTLLAATEKRAGSMAGESQPPARGV